MVNRPLASSREAGRPRFGVSLDPASVNRWLMAGLVSGWVSGTIAFATGSGWMRPIALTHGATGLLLLLLVPFKSPIVHRGMRRRPAERTWPSVALAVLVVIVVVTGLLRSAGLVLSYGPIDDMQVHVGAALAAGPLAVWHLIARPNKRGPSAAATPATSMAGRRAVLRGGVLIGGAALSVGAWEAAIHTIGWPGAGRRATGSYARGSHQPADMPVTIWFNDRVPTPTDDWRLTVEDAEGERRLAVADIAARAEPVTAILDCTGGWYAEQTWSGVRLDDVVSPSSADLTIVVRSVTGYARRFPLTDLSSLWLATGYEDQPLRIGHGAPVRLVAPHRRGFWWVKWVESIGLDDRPWWWQPPFPLT
jgi:hypothetical protein